MAPSFQYVGQLPLKHMMKTVDDDCRGVKSMDWASFPGHYADKAKDLIAVTGDIGTAVFYRHDPEDGRKKDMDFKWEQLYRFEDLQGQLCIWNPCNPWEDGINCGNLLVAPQESNTDSGKLIMIKKGKHTKAEQNTIYEGHQDHRKLIRSVCWSIDGKIILIFHDKSNVIHSLAYERLNEFNQHWVGTDIQFDASNSKHNLVGCFPTSADLAQVNIFAAAGHSTNIKVFMRSNEDTAANPWKVLCESPTDVRVTAYSMSFNSKGDVLFVNTQQHLIGYQLKVANDGTRRNARIECLWKLPIGIEHMSCSISKDPFFLAIASVTLQSVEFIEPVESDGTAHIRRHPNVLKGALGIPPFNAVNQIKFCPRRMKSIAILNDDGITFWEQGSLRHSKHRDLVAQKFGNDTRTTKDTVGDFGKELHQSTKNLGILWHQVYNEINLLKDVHQQVRHHLKSALQKKYRGEEVNETDVLEDIYKLVQDVATA